MSQYAFRLPDVGEGTTEAEIVGWHVAAGDRIEEDKPLVDVSTDKAVVEIPSPVTGRVMACHGEVGERMPVGSVLVEIRLEGDAPVPSATDSDATSTRPEAVEALAAPSPNARSPAASSPNAPSPNAPSPAASSAPSSTPTLRTTSPRASPATRRKAQELGVALESVVGTGPSGRITDGDLQRHVQGSLAAAISSRSAEAGTEDIREIKIIGLRRAIAEKMILSKRSIPHFTYVEEFDLTELESLRSDLNDRRAPEQPKLTLLPFLMRAVVKLVPAFPRVNARYDDDARVLRCYRAVHIGIATQTESGLMVPVIRDAQHLDLWNSARQVQRVSTAAREGRAPREELVGSTITLTSLGALGGISATPIINHPEVAIIGPNKLVERPIVRHGAIVIRTMMNLSASFDHRIIDGHEAARFVQALKSLIERPALLFLDG